MSCNTTDVAKEYEKDKNIKKEDVKNLLDWASKQPHLPPITELQAIIFLQSCYYSNEAAKNTLDTFFTVRTLCPDIFGNRNYKDPAVKKDFDVALMTILNKLTPDGYVVYYFRLADCNPDNYIFSGQIRNFDMTTMAHLYNQGTNNGMVMIIDMDGMVFGHLTKLSIVVMKKFLYYLQEAMPIRLKGMHFINVVPFMDKVLAIMKPFMKKELLSMLHIHGDSIDSLYKFVPQDCLPQERGGSCESFSILHEKTKKNINDNMDLFKWEESQIVDESKRPGKPKNAGDFFGMEGTFKKLEVD